MLDILLRPIWSIIVKWGGVFVGVIFILFKSRQAGKDAERVDNLKATLKGMQKRDEVENTVTASNDSQYKRLRKKWER